MIIPVELTNEKRGKLIRNLNNEAVKLTEIYSTRTTGSRDSLGSIGVMRNMLPLIKSYTKDETLVPENTFGRISRTKAVLEKHTDRWGLDWTVTFPLDEVSARWPFVVEDEVFQAKVGEGILIDGRNRLHWREPCHEGPSIWLLLHYRKPTEFSPIVVKGFLSPEQVQNIYDLESGMDFEQGTTSGNNQERVSQIAWLQQHVSQWQWLHDMFTSWMLSQLPSQYAHDSSRNDAVQFTRYFVGGKYGKHQDRGDENNRVLSATILLRNADSGGEFELEGTIYNFEPGDAVMFLSTMQHQVRLVKAGQRDSLVFWLSGG